MCHNEGLIRDAGGIKIGKQRRTGPAPRRPVGYARAGGGGLRRTLLIGLLVMPVVFGVTFCGLVVTSQAMFGLPSASIGSSLAAIVENRSLRPPTSIPEQSPTPLPTVGSTAAAEDQSSSNDSVVPPSPLPSLTPSITYTPSATASPSATPSETPTNTPTASETATGTASPTATASGTSTPSRTPTPSRTNTPRPTSTPSNTPGPPTAIHSPAPPSETPTATLSPTPGPSATEISCAASVNAGYENTIISLVNNERNSRGLYSYAPQTQLQAAARIHATDMACNGFASHTGSDGSSVRDRVEAQGYDWSWIGENYMITGNGPQAAFDWWMNSELHRNNILSPNFTEFGVGVISTSSTDYYVIVFARPG